MSTAHATGILALLYTAAVYQDSGMQLFSLVHHKFTNRIQFFQPARPRRCRQAVRSLKGGLPLHY